MRNKGKKGELFSRKIMHGVVYASLIMNEFILTTKSKNIQKRLRIKLLTMSNVAILIKE